MAHGWHLAKINKTEKLIIKSAENNNIHKFAHNAVSGLRPSDPELIGTTPSAYHSYVFNLTFYPFSNALFGVDCFNR